MAVEYLGIVHVTILFNNTVPTPTIQFTTTQLVLNYYVGLNFTWRCDVRIPGSQLIGVDAVVEWMGPGGMLTSSNNGRLTVGELDVDSPGREYRRLLTFSPLSASDMGSYSCSATVMPTVDNSGVTNGMRIGSDNLTVASKISIWEFLISQTISFFVSFSTYTGCLC